MHGSSMPGYRSRESAVAAEALMNHAGEESLGPRPPAGGRRYRRARSNSAARPSAAPSPRLARTSLISRSSGAPAWSSNCSIVVRIRCLASSSVMRPSMDGGILPRPPGSSTRPRRSISARETVAIVLGGGLVLGLQAEPRAEGGPDLPDLTRAAGAGPLRVARQVPVAELDAGFEVQRDRLLRRLLPGDEDQEFLEGGGVGVAGADALERLVGRPRLRPDAGGEDLLGLDCLLPLLAQFAGPTRLREGGLGFQRGIEPHGPSVVGDAALGGRRSEDKPRRRDRSTAGARTGGSWPAFTRRQAAG